MKSIISKVPVPMAGLMLALAAAGNLVSTYGAVYKNIFGIASTLLLLLLILKIVLNFKSVVSDIENPVVAGVSPTFPMGIMILSTYLKPSTPSLAYGIWITGIALHCILLIYFTKKFILTFNIRKVFPSYFVVYVGTAAISVTAPQYSASQFGQRVFWFAFITYLILLPVVLYRVIKLKGIPEPAMPSLAIFAAPSSLCLAGYLSSFQHKNMVLVWILADLSLLMLLSVLIIMPKLLRLKFYPSYAAFTFPFVISAIAIKSTDKFLTAVKQPVSFFYYLVKFEEVLAVVMVIYVLIKYIDFLFVKNTDKPAAANTSI